jgi:antitoxin CcdA
MRRIINMNAPSRRSKTAKRAVNVSIRADLVEEAKTFHTNISAVVEHALEQEHREKRREKWRKENREAILEANEELRESGLWSDGLRTF